MSQCVPSWDAAGRDADQLGGGGGCSSSYFVTSNNMFYFSKSKTWDHDDRHGLADKLPAAVPGYDQVAELTWKDGHPAMQDLGSRAPNRGQKLSCSSFGATAYQWAGDQPAMVLTRRSQDNDKEVEGTLDAIVARSLDVPVPNLPPIDEDMVSWFQCPLSDLQEPPPLKKSDKNNNNGGINNDPDALVPSTTSDKSEYAFVHSISSKSQASTPGSILSLPQHQYSPKERDGSINFSHFSKPAVMMKAHLHALGSASGPTNIKRVRQYSSGDEEVAVSNGMPDSIVGSTRRAGGGLCGTNSEDSRPALSTHANTLTSKNCPAPPPNLPGRKSSKAMPSATTTTTTISDHDGMIGKAVEDQSRASATFGKEIITSDLNYDAMEVTLVSTSGGSPNDSMTEKTENEPCSTKWKRKSRDDEDSGCQSEDDDQSSQAKKSLVGRRSNSNKRSRAAAVHNQSERRRRDRINEKMKALQKLIPNSSKTDKASMLDEAIEYLKHLQAQLQMMCLRNGMNIPPMMLPLGMQQLQMSLLASLGPMGLGMGMTGMGLGMGMGMMDMNPVAATGRAAMVPMGQPLPGAGSHALPVSVHPATFIQPNLAAAAAAAAGFPSDTNDRLQNSALGDPYSAFMACQRQSMNMDLYNSMMLLQQQQLLHQQQQPPQLINPYHQQQQQQHSHPQQQQQQMDKL